MENLTDFEVGIALLGSFMLALFLTVIIRLIIGHHNNKILKRGCSCGGNYEYFDTDSQGGCGYMCDKCGKTIWL